ncbi:MAG: hypothetical protein WA655_09505 [Candidatus Korobacteraceae bacterium]
MAIIRRVVSLPQYAPRISGDGWATEKVIHSIGVSMVEAGWSELSGGLAEPPGGHSYREAISQKSSPVSLDRIAAGNFRMSGKNISLNRDAAGNLWPFAQDN